MENPYTPPIDHTQGIGTQKFFRHWGLLTQIPSIFWILLLVAGLFSSPRIPRFKLVAVGVSALACTPIGLLFFSLAKVISDKRWHWWRLPIWLASGAAWAFSISLTAQIVSLQSLNRFEFPAGRGITWAEQFQIAVGVAKLQFLDLSMVLVPLFAVLCWRLQKININVFGAGQPNHHMSSDGAASGPAGYPER